MFVLCGVLLALGLLLRMAVTVYLWYRAGGGMPALRPLSLLVVNGLGVVAAGMLVYYGQRVLRGGHISGGSSGKPIL